MDDVRLLLGSGAVVFVLLFYVAIFYMIWRLWLALVRFLERDYRPTRSPSSSSSVRREPPVPR